MSNSQFEGLFKARKEGKPPAKKRQGSSKKDSPTPPEAIKKKSVAISKKKKIPAVAKSDKNSDFEQTLVYLKKDTKLRVKIALLEDAAKKDFSDLVEELLTGWLKKQK